MLVNIYVMPPSTSAATKVTLPQNQNQFRGLNPNCQPWRTISDSETNLKVGGEEADGASHLPRKNPFLSTQPMF
jgi:hypothetical protein